MNITLNPEQRLYVLKHDGGVSCHGFENVKRDAEQLAARMSMAALDLSLGTIETYNKYLELLETFRKHPASQKTWFQPGTDPKVAKALETARENGSLVRLFLGNPETGFDWCEEHDQVGFVGRSSGTLKVPLLTEALYDGPGLIADNCGGAILCANIIRVIEVFTGKTLYCNPNYQQPQFAVVPASEELCKQDYRWSVLRTDDAKATGSPVANCKSRSQADEYVAFMQGHRLFAAFRTKAQAAANIEL